MLRAEATLVLLKDKEGQFQPIGRIHHLDLKAEAGYPMFGLHIERVLPEGTDSQNLIVVDLQIKPIPGSVSGSTYLEIYCIENPSPEGRTSVEVNGC